MYHNGKSFPYHQLGRYHTRHNEKFILFDSCCQKDYRQHKNILQIQSHMIHKIIMELIQLDIHYIWFFLYYDD